ncbi:hypothetical protein SGR_134 [Streptomyces griseus subsp. griseus NBRC 13350]|uniref:Uncharacterized protein n=1 Tax=Streptomyces griseus subsp. griseus (strain JCM 4626 / CBS 651.72 / NBRC 13350 / KCC S-0626 / ISP 5235) TaxID=455632 RepID=B1VNE0_STRGG|nr:hypothetical protein SGR_134 [Streptomyces griseus subsp. griseus NBRC 13350]
MRSGGGSGRYCGNGRGCGGATGRGGCHPYGARRCCGAGGGAGQVGGFAQEGGGLGGGCCLSAVLVERPAAQRGGGAGQVGGFAQEGGGLGPLSGRPPVDRAGRCPVFVKVASVPLIMANRLGRWALRLGVRVVGTVMAMREGSRLCVMCGTGLLGGTAYLVDGARRQGRRTPTRFLICGSCYDRGCPDPETGLTRAVSTRQTQSIEWRELAGRGPALPPQACVAGCGLVVVRGAEKTMRGVTCSRACRTSITRKRHGGIGSSRPCGACGTPVTAGRADSEYCNAACRQKAYRSRRARRLLSNPVPDQNLHA